MVKIEATNCNDDFYRRHTTLRATSGDKSVTWSLPDRLIQSDLFGRIVDELVSELAERQPVDRCQTYDLTTGRHGRETPAQRELAESAERQ